MRSPDTPGNNECLQPAAEILQALIVVWPLRRAPCPDVYAPEGYTHSTRQVHLQQLLSHEDNGTLERYQPVRINNPDVPNRHKCVSDAIACLPIPPMTVPEAAAPATSLTLPNAVRQSSLTAWTNSEQPSAERTPPLRRTGVQATPQAVLPRALPVSDHVTDTLSDRTHDDTVKQCNDADEQGLCKAPPAMTSEHHLPTITQTASNISQDGARAEAYTYESLMEQTKMDVRRHPVAVNANAGTDARWHLWGSTSTQLHYDNLTEWLHGYCVTRRNVLYQGFQGGKRFRPKQPTVWCMNSFFWKMLRDSGLDGVKRWGRSADLSHLNQIIIPIHHPGVQVVGEGGTGGHWTVVVIDLVAGTLLSIDSFRHHGSPTDIPEDMQNVLDSLEEWLRTILPRTRFAENSEFEHEEWIHLQTTYSIQWNRVECGIHM